ncbi:hypothetical protein [Sphingomonas sp. PB4P5]|uniref:hypothetical protein n=1 Tax=Parasphingomonas puruogangriensis TaxID=3096155 RepID=UPI002FC9C49F
MITGNTERMKVAVDLLRRFIAIGQTKDAKRKAALQSSPAGWPVTRDMLARQLRNRLGGKLPEQLGTSYCGPAAFLFCLIHDRPDVYVKYALSLWEHGHFRFGNKNAMVDIGTGSGTINAATKLVETRAKDGKHRYINDLDWMTMSCLSVSTRPFGIGAVAPDDKLGSVTYPRVLRKWFVATGAAVRANTMGEGLLKSSMAATLHLMRNWGNSWIVLQIDSSLLQGGNTSTFEKRHWVVVDPHKPPMVRKGTGEPWMPMGDAAGEVWKVSPDRIAEGLEGYHLKDWDTNLQVASWGDEHYPIHGAKLGQTIGRIYGGYAFGRFK